MKITTSYLFLFIALFSLTVKSEDYQYQYCGKQNDPTYLFCAPVQFTRNGMQYYLKTIFNDPTYVQSFLPYSLIHFIQFIEHGKDTKQNGAYIEYTLRLWGNKLKAVPYISAEAFSVMLGKIPTILKGYITTYFEDINFDHIKDSIKNTLYDMFLTRFTVFKQEPEQFLDDLSTMLVKKINTVLPLQQRVEQERLKQSLIRFLETNLSRIIWNPGDQIYVWDSIKIISKQLAELMHQHMINQDDLDDLYRSLTERFCYFLDLTGSDLTLEVINIMKEDVAEGKLFLFTLEEQEDLIETRAERMMSALLQTEAKIHARMYGMVTDVLVYDR